MNMIGDPVGDWGIFTLKQMGRSRDMILTEQQQKKLTEFLGECFHEPRPTITAFGGPLYGGDITCKHCGASMPWLNSPLPNARLDFTDWRTVGRLIEKLEKFCTISPSFTGKFWRFEIDDKVFGQGESPQEAIVMAVLAYLEDV